MSLMLTLPAPADGGARRIARKVSFAKNDRLLRTGELAPGDVLFCSIQGGGA
jgi:hypothetical protein